MTKLFTFLFTLVLAAIAAMWFIDNDGSLTIEWLGYHIQTSMAFAILASIVVLVICTTLLQFLLWVKAAPKKYKKAMRDKRRDNGLTALTSGFAAIAAGDIKQARRLNKQASNYLGNIPITKLLSAQTAQLEGDRELAKVHYTAMLENKETETIAIKGLLVQARQDGDLNKAIFLAEKAISLKPNAEWAILILLDLYKITKRWADAEKIVQKAQKLKVITSTQAKRSMALMSLEMCTELLQRNDLSEALKYAEKSYKALPDFQPVAANYAYVLLKAGNSNKAAKILENNWKNATHPDTAELYMQLFANENSEKKLKHAEKLLSLAPNSVDGHLIVAKTSMICDNASLARNHLKMALTISETRKICNLMVDLERQEGSDQEIIDQWRQRTQTSNADPAWSCTKCGFNTEKWHTSCNNCNSFDSLKWHDHAEQEAVTVSPERELLAS